MRIASHPETRWTKKAATWNPDLSIGAKPYRAVGRPKNNIYHFLMPEETDKTERNTWIRAARDQKRWNDPESQYVGKER